MHAVRLDSRANLHNWKRRLTPDEIQRMRDLTEDTAALLLPGDRLGIEGAFTMPTTIPLVSIVTPSYNQAHFLEETIRSVLDQDYPNIEYIIVDGGSTDGSLEIIERYADRLAWWVSEPDQGQTDAINKGFARARGEILAWLNSDDTYLPHAVAKQWPFLQAHPEAGMVYGDANLVDEAGKVIGRFPARQTDYRRLRRGYVHIPQQASFFRASLWRQVGPLDPTFYFAMDYDLWVRLARLAPLHYTPRLWANFRLHAAANRWSPMTAAGRKCCAFTTGEGGSWFSWLVFKAKSAPWSMPGCPLAPATVAAAYAIIKLRAAGVFACNNTDPMSNQEPIRFLFMIRPGAAFRRWKNCASCSVTATWWSRRSGATSSCVISVRPWASPGRCSTRSAPPSS